MNQRPPPTDPFDGLLLVDKPAGPTSHDVVDRLRRHFRLKKVGHGGTLDPQATGLLLILLGRGTKLSDQMLATDKTYEGILRLGSATATHDADGEIVKQGDFLPITCEQLLAAMAKFLGDIYQIPPMVSAVKMDGVPLYKLARRGQEVERQPRLIHIYEFNMLDFTPPDARFIIRCTKGTYVRTICNDVGEALGCGAHLAQLRRTQAGPFTVDKAFTMPALLQLQQIQLLDYVIPLHRLTAMLKPG